MKESSVNPDTVASRTDYAFKPTRFVFKSLSQTVIKVRGVDIVQFINTSPITVTNILDGNDNQDIILYGDGQTTLQNNSNIVTISGANLLLASGRLYQFINFLGAWRQLV